MLLQGLHSPEKRNKKQKIKPNQTEKKKNQNKNKAHEFGVEVGIGDSSDLV